MDKSVRIKFRQQIIIKPNSLVLYTPRDEIIGGNKRYKSDFWQAEDSNTEIKIMPKSNLTNGFLSMKAQSRLNNSIKYMFWLTGLFKINNKKISLLPNSNISFVTLTLSAPQIDSDTYIKTKMLNQFITELKERYPKILYIWRAEKQKNGNIHFHFLMSIFIKWEIIRKIWNRIQKKEGYLGRYTDKFSKLSFEEYLLTIIKPNPDKIHNYKLAYKKGYDNGWTDPNSIDVVTIKKVKSIYAYLSKYLSKTGNDIKTMPEEEQEKLKIEGHIYYCCERITRIQKNVHIIDSRIIEELDLIHITNPDKIHYDEYFTCIAIPIEKLWQIGCKYIFELFIINLNKPVS